MTTVLESLNAALHDAFTVNPRVCLIGEDVLDPYGGAFKVTSGLSSAYPQRVLAAPISEAGITGLAAGMALRGMRPVVEIMFGDFVTLAADQLINHIAKFRWMYNDQVRVPLVVRTPMGGRRGYGPTHSQTLEKLFLGVPGLRVLAPAALGNPGRLLAQAILEDDDPVVFIENKLQYLQSVQSDCTLPEYTFNEIYPELTAQELPGALAAGSLQPAAYAPCYRLAVRDAPAPALTLVAYGYMAELARQAMLALAYEEEIFCELIVPTQLSPFQLQPVFDSVRQAGRLLVIEEGAHSLGWGAEILARTAEAGLRPECARRLAALDLPVPASGPLESLVLPGVPEIRLAARQVLGR
jgi:pyruvate/2-oxoglutarate/acetoin dehydrogenase E1 component